jgi:aminoglycoside phosphotransferase (APT) family kinase protein
MHPGQGTVSPETLGAAVAAQFPEYADHPVCAVSSAGTQVAPFRVGPGLLARLPLVPAVGDAVVDRVTAEGRFARALSAHLPVAVPELVGVGEPFPGYDGTWSLWTWLDGQSLDLLLDDAHADVDLDALPVDLARVLNARRSMPADGAPWSGNGRGGAPLADSEWVRMSIGRSRHLVDPVAATQLWETALSAPAHAGPPLSIAGDPVPGNLLVTSGRLSGMIDIGEPVVGDPAADLQPAWQILEEPQRAAFREAMGLDDAAWERGRGWAFEMAIGGLHYYEHTNLVFFRLARRTLARLLAAASR